MLPDKKDATKISPADFEGKNVVLFSYPKAMTTGCTVGSCGFHDRAEKFTAIDTDLVGISTDELDAQESSAPRSGPALAPLHPCATSGSAR